MLLSIAQLIYNISINAITDQILFFINHRYNANLFLILKKATVLIKKAQITVSKMLQLHKKL